MPFPDPDLDWRPMLLFALGGILVVGTIGRSVLRRFDVPDLVGYLLLGLALGVVDRQWLHLPANAHHALSLLADLGIVCLLFKVGLDSDLGVLLRELPRAAVVLVSSVALSAAAGFGAAHALGFGLVPSLFVAVALSATSIAVAVYVWQGAGRLRSPPGALVLDVAELDDLATVVLMVVLFAVAPALAGQGATGPGIVPALGQVLAKVLLFGCVCWLFARHGEAHVTASFRRLGHAPDPMLVVVGVAFVVAAFAAWLGFSLAVGAMFAGLVFSRDPRAVRVEASFEPVHGLLAPFFFVAVGAELDPAVLAESAWVGAVLLIAAVVGKVGGTLLGLWTSFDARTRTLVAVSMVPRAEVALFVTSQGRALLPEHVPPVLDGAMVLVVAATCLGTPPVLRRLMRAAPR